MPAKAFVFKIPEGTALPDGLVLYHEHTDHFSMQTSVACLPQELNKKLTEFVSQFSFYSKEDYFRRYGYTA